MSRVLSHILAHMLSHKGSLHGDVLSYKKIVALRIRLNDNLLTNKSVGQIKRNGPDEKNCRFRLYGKACKRLEPTYSAYSNNNAKYLTSVYINIC
jgi:hypothetical protein